MLKIQTTSRWRRKLWGKFLKCGKVANLIRGYRTIFYESLTHARKMFRKGVVCSDIIPGRKLTKFRSGRDSVLHIVGSSFCF